MTHFYIKDIHFASDKHRVNFLQCCRLHRDTDRRLDEEVLPMFYLIALVEEEKGEIRHRIYDFDKRVIKPGCLNESWQTSSTLKAIRLAFNLWNGFIDPNNEESSTPYNLFENSWAPYFAEAIKLRFKGFFDPPSDFCRTVYGTSAGRLV